jgi:hypothetical protein
MACEKVWKGMVKKDLCEEGIAEGEALSRFTPTLEDFEDMDFEDFEQNFQTFK